jgi:WD40 repeat protein
MSQSPFKFLDSFTKEDKDIYFGREREAEEVYTRIFQSKLLLVYGLSGTGKSSLIQCGLANRLNDSDWLPISVRRAEDIMASLWRNIQKHGLSGEAELKGAPDSRSVRKALRSLYLDQFKPIYLIFDQFEELFIFGTDEERSQFVNLVADVLASDLQCRFIFVIREEYLASLTEFEGDLPELFSNRIRIEKMTRAQAKAVIEGPCHVAGISLEDGFAEALLQRISPERNEVELTYLQVYLDRLWRLASAKGEQRAFTLAMLDSAGSITDLLGSFLEEQVAQMPDPQHALAMLKAFVSTRGTKRQNTVEEAQAHARTLGTDISEDEVLALTERFVSLRILRDKDDNGRYELRHDALAAKIFEKITLIEKELLEVRQFVENACQTYRLRGIRLTAQDIEFVAPYRERLFLPEEQERFFEECRTELEAGQRLKRRVNIVSLIGLVALIAATAYYFYMESTRSRSHELAALSLLELEDDPALGFLLAEKAYGVELTKLAERALINALHNGPYLYEVNGFDPQVSFDGKYVLSINPIEGFRMERDAQGARIDQDSSLTLWNMRGDAVARIGPFSHQVHTAGFLQGQHRVYLWTTDTVLHVADTTGTVVFSKKVEHFENTWTRVPQSDFEFAMLTWAKPNDKDVTVVWTVDLRDGKSHEFEVKRNVPESLSYSEFLLDGKVVIVDGNHVRVFNPDGVQSNAFTAFSYSPDRIRERSQNFVFKHNGKLLCASQSEGKIRFFDLKGIKLDERSWAPGFKIQYDYRDLLLSSSDKRIEVVNDDGNVVLDIVEPPFKWGWFYYNKSYYGKSDQFFASDGMTGNKLLFNFSGERPFTPTSQSGSTDRKVSDANPNKALIFNFGKDAPVFEFDAPTVLSEDGNFCMTYDNDRQVSVWDLSGKPNKIVVYRAAHTISPVLLSNKGDVVLQDRKGKLYFGYMRRDLLPTFSNSNEKLVNYCISDSTPHLATLLEGGRVNIWHTDGKLLSAIKLPTDSAALWVKFSNDGKHILTLGGDQRLSLHETAGKHVCDHWPYIDWRNALNVASFAPDGSEFAYITKDMAVQRVGTDGRPKQELRRHTRPVTGVSYSTKSGFMVSVSLDSLAVVWRANGGDYKPVEEVSYSGEATSVEFNNDGLYFITACSDTSVYVTNLKGEARSLINSKGISNEYNRLQYDAPVVAPVSHVRFVGRDQNLVLTYRDILSDTLFLEGKNGEFTMKVNRSFSDPIAQYAHSTSSEFAVLGADAGLQVIDLSPSSSLNVRSKENMTGDILLNSGLGKVLTLRGHLARFSTDGKRMYYINEDGILKFLPVDPTEILRLVNEEKIFGNKRKLTETELLEFGF